MAEAFLTLQDVLVQYGDSTILDLSELSIYPGEVLAITGPNGAGKSTLLRVMGLLEQPKRGKVFFQGMKVDQRSLLPVRRRMASVFQQALLLNASVYENAALGWKLRGLDRQSIEQRVQPWLQRLGIAHLAQRRARTLSGGEAQRTSLARALALDPELLLLDEPFSALDHPTREELLLDLETILHQTGITTVFVTHDRNEAVTFGHRVGVLIAGKLLQIGSTSEVFSHPANEEVAQFVGIETKITGLVEKYTAGKALVRFDGGAIEIKGNFQLGEPLLLCLRPEDIILSPPAHENLLPNGLNRLMSKIVKIRPWGFHHRVELDCGGNHLVAFITRRSLLEAGLAEGKNVIASFKETDVHVMKPGR